MAVATVGIHGVTFQRANQRPNAERERRRLTAALPASRVAPAPPSALSRAGKRVAMVAGAGLFPATLLPWMITTDTSLTYLTYSYPGTYSAGTFATICGS